MSKLLRDYKKREIFFGFLLFLNDLVFLALAFFIGFLIKFRIETQEILGENIKFYLIYSAVGIVAIIIIFYFKKLYNFKSLYGGMGENENIITSIIIGVFVIIILNYYFNRDSYQLSRLWIIYSTILAVILVIVSRFFAKKLIFKLLRTMNVVTTILIIGANEEGRRIAETFGKNKIEKVKIAGFIDDGDTSNTIDIGEEFKIWGDLENLEEVIDAHGINRIIISSKIINYFQILELLDKVKDRNIEVQMSPSLFEFSVSRIKMFESMGIPLIQIQKAGIRGIDKFFKFLIDYSFGIMLFIAFALLYPIIGMLIKLDSKGPVLYTQERYGKDFKKIKIYKFRTMRAGADQEEDIIKAVYNRDQAFKLKEDPRITKVGKFLRKTSLDELPQAINVLKNDISLVGPRAIAVEEGDQLEGWEKKRMQVNQGITGLWQVSGRSEISYEERIKLDLYYIHNWSIWLELKIIFLTALKFLPSKDAY